MADKIIKFGAAKKKIKQARKDKRAQENRVKFGRSKGEKTRDKNVDETFKTGVDNHKLDNDIPR